MAKGLTAQLTPLQLTKKGDCARPRRIWKVRTSPLYKRAQLATITTSARLKKFDKQKPFFNTKMMMHDSDEEEEQTALVCDNGKFLKCSV